MLQTTQTTDKNTVELLSAARSGSIVTVMFADDMITVAHITGRRRRRKKETRAKMGFAMAKVGVRNQRPRLTYRGTFIHPLQMHGMGLSHAAVARPHFRHCSELPPN